MNFSILQQDLWPSLQAVARSCGLKSSLPVLGNILIQTRAGKVILSATNLEVGVVKSVKAAITTEGEVTIPAKTLTEIVANLSNSKINFEATSEQLKIKTDSFFSQINGIAASEFPSIPLSGKEAVKIDPGILIKAIQEVSFSAAADEGRPTLTGILTEIKDKTLQLVATDGYRLAHKTASVKEEASFKALIPRRTFEEITRLLAEEEVDEVALSTSEDQNQMIFSFGQTLLSSRLIEGQFPAWEKIVPTEVKAKVTAERGELLKAVKLASIFARSEANVVKVKNEAGKIIITSEAKELGSQQSEVEAQSDGQTVEVAFNSKFLLDALTTLPTNQVILELSGTLSAAILKPMGEAGLEYIIMPVNLG